MKCDPEEVSGFVRTADRVNFDLHFQIDVKIKGCREVSAIENWCDRKPSAVHGLDLVVQAGHQINELLVAPSK